MPRVTESATPAQIEQLERLVSDMAASADRGEPFPETDRAFHEELYRPLGNKLIIQLLQAFWDIFYAVGQDSSRRTILLRETTEEHRAILAAITDGRGVEAAAAMSAHFAGAEEWVPLLESAPSGTTPA